MHAPVARGFSWTVLGSLVLGLNTIAFANPIGKDSPRKDSPAELLRKSLDFSITLELNDTPLGAVVQQLADMSKVNIVLDRSGIVPSGDLMEALVSLKAKDMKLRTALRTVAGQHGLTFGIVGDHILISSEEIVNARQLRQRINIDLDGATLNSAIRDLAAQTGTNLVVDPRSQKTAGESKLTLKLDDVPLETALRLMAEVAGLKPVRMGNVLFITSEERAEKLKADGDGGSNTPHRETGTVNSPPLPAPMILPPGGGAPAPAVPRG